MRHTHSQRLERWLGAAAVEDMSANMRDWYGPPIAVGNVPGRVYATRGGDFVGPIRGGYFASLADYATERAKRVLRNAARRQSSTLNTGFASLSDLISEATTGGKRQDIWYGKAGTLAVTAAQSSLWNVGSFPAAGGTPAARPGGAVPTNATTGSFVQTDPGGSDTLHLVTMVSQGSASPNTLILYDRTFHAGTINHNTSAAQTVTGVPTRYATTTSPGVFAFLEVTTVLTATAFNITLQYTDQAGAAAENAPSLAGIVSSAVTRIPHAQFFIPLNSGDTGLRTITQITFSAAAASGVSNIVMGKPLAFIPQPASAAAVVMDGINSAFSLVQVLTGACLAFLELKGTASATTYTGSVIMVAG